MLCCWAAAAAGAAAAVPPTMRAAVAHGVCAAPFRCLKVENVTTPTPGHGEVLIKVGGSGVNPCDVDVVKWGQGCPASSRGIVGSDVAGEVAAVGAGCTRLKVGDKVWADMDGPPDPVGGAIAEYVAAAESRTGLRPLGLSVVEAGTLPLVGQTMLQGFQATGAPWSAPNVTVVVTSGSGGTGFIGVQLAKALGAARVITAASGASTIEYVKSIGADVVVDYKTGNIFDAIPDGSVDVVYDNYGAKGSADLAMPKMRSGGTILVLAGGNGGAPSTNPRKDVKQIGPFILTASSVAALDTLKGMFDAGKLRAKVQQVFPLAEAAAAFALNNAGQVVGKVAVKME